MTSKRKRSPGQGKNAFSETSISGALTNMLHESYLEFEQELRIDNDHAALAEWVSQIDDMVRDLRSSGKFDGLIGNPPTLPENEYYWQSYCEGLRQHHLSGQYKQLPD